MIKAILFDIDGVLVDSFRTNYLFFKKILHNNGYKFVTKKEFKSEGKFNSLPMKDIFRKLYPELSREIIEQIFQSAEKVPYRHKKTDLPYGEISTIPLLSNKFILALVTSRIKRGVLEYFRVSGLKDCFSVVSCYEDYSKPKPDPEPLMIALAKLNLKPEQAVYVGDSESDLLAAKAIGMKFIGFYGISGKIFKEADANVKNFKELEEVIFKLG